MFKKFLFIFLAGVILVTLMVTDAAALTRCTRSTVLRCSDLTLEVCVTGLKSEDVFTAVCSATYIADAEASAFINPGGGANTVPASPNFDGALLSETITQVSTADMTGPGTACLTYTVARWIDDVYPAIADAMGAPNPQWVPVDLYIGDIRTVVIPYQVDKKSGDMKSGSGVCITGTAEAPEKFDGSTCATDYLTNSLYFETSTNLDQCLSVPSELYNLMSICDAAIAELYN